MNGWLAPKYLGWLWQGFGMTLGLSVLVMISATACGFVLALARSSRAAPLRQAAAFYVLVFRNSPLIVQLLFWYFGVATLLPETAMNWLNAPHRVDFGLVSVGWPSFEFVAGWFGLTCYTTAFIGEEFRAGLSGVPAGQHQAALALGLTPLGAFVHVILPQAIRIATPPLFGQYMNVVKNSSLTMAIGLAELSYVSRQIDTETFKTFQSFGAATVLYILTIAVIETGLVLTRRTSASTGRR
ncbi:amino acid ABC transporter permease [Paraburkholderia saeva]|uniref:amino acid ABC transporter permease n=1 Tax=Paraburkholderia saeva TaxID=2777537 RepID=UPI001D665320|nr:amino acid ABC transporter permease [Paraburkholderia saeva]CAG4896680.1 Glutamate/aspartate import permease protein GltJ [Paraburkholderia saeva]